MILFCHQSRSRSLYSLYHSNSLTRPEWISFPLVHCIALGDVVELWQATKLFPDSVIVEEGSHGIIYVSNQALRERKQSAKQHLGKEETAQELMQ